MLRFSAPRCTSQVLMSAALLMSSSMLQAQEPPVAEPATIPVGDVKPASKEPVMSSARPEGARYGSFGVGVGTAGLGIDFAYPITPWLDIRAGYDFGSVKFDYDDEDDEEGTSVSGDAKLKFSAGKLLADFKPFRGGFRISAGLYTGLPELDLDASGLDTYEIGEGEYRGDLRAKGKIDMGGVAPYLGIGWGGTTSGTGFGASLDIGVIFGKSPKVDLDINGLACDASVNEDCDPATDGTEVSTNPDFQADRAAEIDEIEDDAKDFDMWPVIRFGLHYRF